MPHEAFICSRTNEPCPTANLCEIANAPLVGAIDRIAEQATGRGKRRNYVGAVLIAELAHIGDVMSADFAPTADKSDAAICPGDVLERGLPGATLEQVAQGIGRIAGQKVKDVVQRLHAEETQRRRYRAR